MRTAYLIGFAALAAALSIGLSSYSQTTTPLVQADLVLLNGKVWTVDPAQPEAVAVWNERILAVGPTSQIETLVGASTKVIDLRGRRAVPGFIDNHVHFLSGGFWLAGVHLKDARSEVEFGKRLARESAELPEGAWIVGGAWDHENWPGAHLPTAEDVDHYVPDRPVFVKRYDGHMSVANSLALKLAGITAGTLDPPGGVIVRKPGSREPTGALKDTAQDLVRRVIPPPSHEENRRAIEAALAEARRFGVTGIHHVSLGAPALRVYQELFEEGKLTTRVNGHWPIAQWRDLADLGIRRNFDSNDWIKIGSLKGMMDGSLGSSTALFFDPYVQDPSVTGVYVTRPEVMRGLVLEADRAGLHIAVHAIGDKANSDILDIFAAAIEANGSRDRRFRVEHSQHIHPKDFERYADLGVIASVQPYHTIDDARWAEKRIGNERCKTSYAFRTFLDSGVKLSFGSDWTVAPLDPVLGIDAAVNRRPLDGAHPGGWFPEQKISVEEAIEAYTLTSAYSSFDDDDRGSITPGKLADIVVLTRDILAIPPGDIPSVEVAITIVGGRVVYEAQR